MDTNGELLTTRQVAEAVGKDVRTISRWVASGRLKPTVRLPGVRGPMMFDPADVNQLGQDEQVEQAS